jgi:hypothetical protein
MACDLGAAPVPPSPAIIFSGNTDSTTRRSDRWCGSAPAEIACVRFTNEYGTKLPQSAPRNCARGRARRGGTRAASALTFDGKPGTWCPGRTAELTVDLRVNALASLSISIYLPEEPAHAREFDGSQTAYADTATLRAGPRGKADDSSARVSRVWRCSRREGISHCSPR